MTMKRAISVGLHVVLVIAMAAPGFAQDVGATEPAASFPKGNYRVQTSDGTTLRGQLLRMNPDTLRMLVDGQPRDVPMSQVDKVDRPTHRARTGLIVGATAGVLMGGLGDCETRYDARTGNLVDSHAPCMAAGGIFYGLVGLGIGWIASRSSAIYRRTASGGR